MLSSVAASPVAAYGSSMSSSALDRLLAALLVLQLASGLLSLRAGTEEAAPLFWLHGLIGGALLVASAEKLRRTVGPAWRRRRRGRLALGTLLTLLVAAALVGGFAWVASGRILSIGPWTVLTLHVWAALAIVPVVLLHLVPRRWRLLRVPAAGPRISRRTFLGIGMVGALGAFAWGAANVVDRVQGGVRRFTGSRWLPDGGIPPVTTFYGEGTPAIEPAAWRLVVTGRVSRPLSLTIAELRVMGATERTEVLDCTSGWAIRTTWRGVPLRAVLDAAGATDPRRVAVVSVTGWMVRLAADELDDAILATHVAGEPLPAGNGAPLRLVAPRRRGLDWIKWVERIEVA
jgi:hypothetical protein